MYRISRFVVSAFCSSSLRATRLSKPTVPSLILPSSTDFSTLRSAMDDEFGDASFLADVDVDKAVEEHRKSHEKADEFGDASFLANVDLNAVDAAQQQSSPNKRQKVAPATSNDEAAILKTLQEFFGYSTFRGGQLQVIQAILQKRDVAVFWATGQGKSICYQIPALHTQHISVVVSPLISLMQDQCHKLNFLSGQPVATYLGSAQQDPHEEQKAMKGEYCLVYVTPEKLVTSGFLDRLAHLHQTKPIGLFAIDESHCVSEWGHDFRPEFRQVGSSLRRHNVLKNIPILALTATAVPRVQQDIVQSLQLCNPLKAQQTFDRKNLKIRVHRKTGMVPAMKGLLETLNSSDIRPTKESTIVYASTRSQVDELTLFLQNNIKTNVQIEGYHAGMTNEERKRAHTNFLTGKTTVIVATVAFGMGIDKPDTRRVVHYGAPKTLEEYYQQIGRAGRDGLPAECIMYASESDFDRYNSDFYLGGLSGQARQATLESMKAMRSYSLDAEACRRKALLDYFAEVPTFGERCGTCDTCLSATTFGDDAQRDFGPLGARVALKAVSAMNEQGVSNILKVLGGNTVEDYRYKSGHYGASVKRVVDEMKATLPKKYSSQNFYRELIPMLAQKGYLSESAKKAVVNGFERTWTTYSITVKGHQALAGSTKVMLPVPETVRETERKEEEKRQKVLALLEANGINRDKLPEDEVEKGDGEVIRAYSKWHSYLEGLRRAGKEDRISQLESLLAIIEKWRLDVATKYQTAPGAVLSEHILVGVAYATATMSPGLKLDAQSLTAAGVKNRELESLVGALDKWVDETQPVSSVSAPTKDASMTFDSISFKPAGPWKHAVYKPVKKTGKASWESSYLRFTKGETPQTIALSPENGRPIQVKTVVFHVLEAIVHGRSLNLQRLSQYMPPPTKSEWEQLQTAEITTGMDVTADPSSSNPNGDKFTMTDFLRPVIGDEVANKEFKDRSESEKEMFGHWCDKLKWYMTLRRAGYEPSFSE